MGGRLVSSTVGHRAITEEAVAIVSVVMRGDLNSDGSGRRHTCAISQRELVAAVLDLGAKQTTMLQLAV